MADGTIQVPPDSTGKKVDGASLDVGLNSVIRQRIIIADNAATAGFAAVINSALQVGGAVSLAAGTANIGTINNISATVNTGLSFVVEKTTGSQVQVGDSLNAAVRVNIVAGSASGPSNIDNTTYSTGVTTVAPSGFIHFSASATTMTEGRVGAARITAERGVHTNLRNNAGTEIGTPTTPLSVRVENQSATVVMSFASPQVVNNISATVNTVVGAGTANIGGVSLVAGTANIGFINNISATVTVAGIIALAAGAANIGIVNNISATVNTVVGAGTANIGGVSLVAGTANIGFINNISATVTVAGIIALAAGAANIGIVNNISATVNTVVGAGASNIGFINHVSATVTVAGIIALTTGTANIGTVNNISATVNTVVGAGASNIGFINHISATVNVSVQTPFTINNISATVTVVTANSWVNNIPSASHGPIMKILSTSAIVNLTVAPGAGLSIYMTQLYCSNASAVPTGIHLGYSASPEGIVMHMAANGGGFVLNFDPPWKFLSNEQIVCRIDATCPGNVYIHANFFVAP